MRTKGQALRLALPFISLPNRPYGRHPSLVRLTRKHRAAIDNSIADRCWRCRQTMNTSKPVFEECELLWQDRRRTWGAAELVPGHGLDGADGGGAVGDRVQGSGGRRRPGRRGRRRPVGAGRRVGAAARPEGGLGRGPGHRRRPGGRSPAKLRRPSRESEHQQAGGDGDQGDEDKAAEKGDQAPEEAAKALEHAYWIG